MLQTDVAGVMYASCLVSAVQVAGTPPQGWYLVNTCA